MARFAPRPPADGFEWAGGSSVRVHQAPGLVAASSGWLVPWLRSHRLDAGNLGPWLVASFVVTLYSDALYHALFVAQMAYWTLVAVERYAPRQPARYLYQFSWDARQVYLQGADGLDTYDVSDVRAVTWEPVEWHGLVTRRAMRLGARVTLELADGTVLLAGCGFDTRRLRGLAERLASDLGVDMIERLTRPIVRSPRQLNAPITARLTQLERTWQRMPSYSRWKARPIAGGYELRMARGDWRGAALASLAEQSGDWLLAVIGLELLRLPALVWLTLLGTVPWLQPLPHLVPFGAVDVGDLGLLLVASLPMLRAIYRAHQPRVLSVNAEHLTYEVAGELVAAMRTSDLEQVRLESFPRSAVRLISDHEEVVIADLPGRVDYEALADQLPHLIPDPARQQPAS